MAVELRSNDAGGFADDRFRQRRRAWRRRIWWVLPLVAVWIVAVAVVFGLLVARDHLSLYVAFAAGTALGLVLAVWDSPPAHIENWRQGAQGEKSTARALRRLERAGWAVIHDIDTGRGNIDHLVAGPPGVFVLDSKNLPGLLSVSGGVLSVRRREDPDDGYDDRRLTARMYRQAQQVEELLHADGVEIPVQPIVVLWSGEFAQGSVLNTGVAWIRGRQLADVLRNRPETMTVEQLSRAHESLQRVRSFRP